MSACVTSLHAGLTQQTYLQYELDSDMKRVPGTTFERYITLHLPLFLTIELWERHEYSLSDIRTTLKFFSAIHLWQCALLYGISPSNSAIKLAFSTPESMVYGSKAIVIKKIEKLLLAEKYKFVHCESILDTIRHDHIPPLPLHYLSMENWTYLQKLIPDNVNLSETITYSGKLDWKDISVVPFWYEKKAIYTVKIIERSIFEASGRIKKASRANQPYRIIVDGKEYCGVEESCFFLPVSAKKR